METALEHILTHSYKDEMIAYLQNHPDDFSEAINLSLSDKQPYAWRSAWLLWSCMEENDSRMQGFIKQIINALPTREDGHQRELLKIILAMEIDEEDEGVLFNICVEIWKKISKRPSIRYTAFMFMKRMSDKYPDLLHEIGMLTDEKYLDPLSPGIKLAVNRMINEKP